MLRMLRWALLVAGLVWSCAGVDQGVAMATAPHAAQSALGQGTAFAQAQSAAAQSAVTAERPKFDEFEVANT